MTQVTEPGLVGTEGAGDGGADPAGVRDAGTGGAGGADPDAFTVTLEAFTGPLDLLLHLIKKNQFDLANLPVAPITDQYVTYVNAQGEFNLDGIGEYMALASELLQLKSRCLLPRVSDAEELDEHDPRRELVNRLLIYRRHQTCGGWLADRAKLAARRFTRGSVDLNAPYRKGVILLLESTLHSLLAEYRIILDVARGRKRPPEEIALEAVKVEDRARQIVEELKKRGPDGRLQYDDVFLRAAPRLDLLVLLLAMLELAKQQIILVRQETPFGEISVYHGPRLNDGLDMNNLLTQERQEELVTTS